MVSRIEGGERLRLAFRVMPRNLRRKTNRQAVAAAARVAVRPIKAAAPRGATGTLSRSIVTSRDRKSRGGAIVRYNVGPRGAGYYGKFLELGTRFITKAPWLEDAFLDQKRAMLRKLGVIWGRGVEREMRKLAGPRKPRR